MPKLTYGKRLELVRNLKNASVTELCRQYNISRPTVYKLRRRFDEWRRKFGGIRQVKANSRVETLMDAKSTPLDPKRVDLEVDAAIAAWARSRPKWGSRRIVKRLQQEGIRVSISTVDRRLYERRRKAAARAKRRQ